MKGGKSVINYRSADGADYFVSTYADMILRICRTYSLDKDDAQDICQEIYIKLFNGGYSFEGPEKEKAFIARAAANACKDILKSGWFKKRANSDEPEEKPDEKADNSELRSAVESLPSKYKEAVYFYYYEGYDINETAKIVGRSAGCVKKRLSRAREMLRKELDVTYETI